MVPMSEAEVAAAAIAAAALRDDEALTELIDSVGAERVIRALAWFAYWQLRGRHRDGSAAALRGQLRQVVQLMDRPNA